MRLLLPEPGPLPPGGLADVYDPGDTGSVRGGFVLSVDGAVAVEGRSRGLHTPSDQAVFRALRTVADAVLVGAGTVRSEDYGPVGLRPDEVVWRQQRARTDEVPLVIVSRRLDLDPTARCFASGRPVVLTCASAPAERRTALARVADVLVHGDDDVDLPLALGALQDRGLRRLLCEGGPTLLASLLARGLLDELCLTVSPTLVGGGPGLLGGALATPQRLELRSVVDGGDGALLCRWGVPRG